MQTCFDSKDEAVAAAANKAGANGIVVTAG